MTVGLTAKSHAFGGAVLSPKHARELTPSLCLGIASALSTEYSKKNIIPYTLWITEAWRVLGWAEPSAALFWEMATMYHTLFVASRVDDNIPPILSCGSHSSLGSVPAEKKQKYSTTAKELPVWLIGTFLLLHCEESAFRREETSYQQKLLSASRARSHAGQQDQHVGYILRHLRKILLLLAVPHNEEAVRACMHLAALPPSKHTVHSDTAMLQKWHDEEHGGIGVGIRLTMDELEKLHFVLQFTGDDAPLDIGKHLWTAIYGNTPCPSNATIPLGEVERLIRRKLVPEVSLAKLSLHESRKADKELLYTNLRGTTIMLTPETTDAQHLSDLVISDCSDCHFYLLHPFEHVSISFSIGCTIVVGAVAGLLHVQDCEKTLITSAARRLLLRKCSDSVCHMFTPSPPLLVGENRKCQLAPYNTYYEGLREDLLATGLAAAILGEAPSSPTSSGNNSWPLQCASNKWKAPVELAKLEIPQVDEDSNKTSTDDAAMQTPILLPASDFHVLFVPVVGHNNNNNNSGGDTTMKEDKDDSSVVPMESHQYCQFLAQALQLSPFRLPTEYERQALGKVERMRNLQALMKTLTEEQQARFEEELNRGFRDWLVTSGNLRQVLDLVHLGQQNE